MEGDQSNWCLTPTDTETAWSPFPVWWEVSYSVYAFQPEYHFLRSREREHAFWEKNYKFLQAKSSVVITLPKNLIWSESPTSCSLFVTLAKWQQNGNIVTSEKGRSCPHCNADSDSLCLLEATGALITLISSAVRTEGMSYNEGIHVCLFSSPAYP